MKRMGDLGQCLVNEPGTQGVLLVTFALPKHPEGIHSLLPFRVKTFDVHHPCHPDRFDNTLQQPQGCEPTTLTEPYTHAVSAGGDPVTVILVLTLRTNDTTQHQVFKSAVALSTNKHMTVAWPFLPCLVQNLIP